MIRFERVTAMILLLGAALAAPAAAAVSASASFRNNSSVMDAGGLRKFSVGFRGDASVGAVSVPSAVSASFAVRDGFMGVAYQPARITDLVAASTCGASSVQLKWTAPGNDGDENTTSGAYVIKYSSVASESPALSDAKFEAAAAIVLPPAPGIRGTLQNKSVAGLTPGVQYYFAIKAAERDGMRGVLAGGAGTLSAFLARLAQTPFGIGLSTGPSAATVSWLPVVRYQDRTAFVDPSAPLPTELSGYRVYRSTTPILAPWTEVATVSTATLSWTDPASGPQYYYTVKAQTFDSCQSTETVSSRSLIRSAATFDAYAVSPDDASYYHIPRSLVAPLVGTPGDPTSAYAIETSSRPEDLGGRIYKSLDFQAYRGGLTQDSHFSLEGMGTVYMHYELSGGSVTPSFASSSSSPDNASVYWWNGMQWLQLYGKGDALSQNMFLETKYFGRYQMRSVERVTNFAFSQAGLSNRFVTPNGDGKNDNVVFTFQNPHDAAVHGRILDLRGRVVASDLQPGPVLNSLQWDGTSQGRSVPGGVYVYQLEGEGHSFTGTLVVLK